MSPEQLREIVREGLDDSLQIADVSTAEVEEPGELYVRSVSGEDFVIRVEGL
jgi:hypothetical protein